MKRIRLIYTGGTIGMQRNEHGNLAPVEFEALLEHIPSLDLLPVQLEVEACESPMDSSDLTPDCWVNLVERIEKQYERCDGWVVMHGTDTMAYTASALSFLLQDLGKPVILTGSQLPLGVLRTDAVENLLSAIEFAAMAEADGSPTITEVAIYFEYKLYRGNRAFKRSSNEFNAFSSPNYPPLAESGVRIKVNKELLHRPDKAVPTFNKSLSSGVGVITLYPGIDFATLPVLEHWKVVLLRTYGAGNVPSSAELAQYLKRCKDAGTLVINTSQCVSGAVSPGLYLSSSVVTEAEVLSASDMTFEAVLTKAMVLLGFQVSADEFRVKFSASWCGERSE